MWKTGFGGVYTNLERLPLLAWRTTCYAMRTLGGCLRVPCRRSAEGLEWKHYRALHGEYDEEATIQDVGFLCADLSKEGLQRTQASLYVKAKRMSDYTGHLSGGSSIFEQTLRLIIFVPSRLLVSCR